MNFDGSTSCSGPVATTDGSPVDIRTGDVGFDMFKDASGRPLPADQFRDSSGAIRSMTYSPPKPPAIFTGASSGPMPDYTDRWKAFDAAGMIASAFGTNPIDPRLSVTPDMPALSRKPSPPVSGGSIWSSFVDSISDTGAIASAGGAGSTAAPAGSFSNAYPKGSFENPQATRIAKGGDAYPYSDPAPMNVSTTATAPAPQPASVSTVIVKANVTADPNSWGYVLQKKNSTWEAVLLDGGHAFRNKRTGEFRRGDSLKGLRGMNMSGLALAGVAGLLGVVALPVKSYSTKKSSGLSTALLAGAGLIGVGLLGWLAYRAMK